eukprot:5718003-Amphidinium_carterae.2
MDQHDLSKVWGAFPLLSWIGMPHRSPAFETNGISTRKPNLLKVVQRTAHRLRALRRLRFRFSVHLQPLWMKGRRCGVMYYCALRTIFSNPVASPANAMHRACLRAGNVSL